jgi:hypothetical protein
MIKRLLLVSVLVGCAGENPGTSAPSDVPPPAATPEQRRLVGEYLLDGDTLSILEAGGSLSLRTWRDGSMVPVSVGAPDADVLPVFDADGAVSSI